MNNIKECAEFYQTLLNRNYRFTLEDDLRFVLFFQKQNFFHLLGLEKLKDLAAFSAYGPSVVFEKILAEEITQTDLLKSVFYPKIESRIRYFQELQNMLDPKQCKVIVDFDKRLVDKTELKNTKYILYVRRDENYVLFTIGQFKLKLYAETFFLEPSKKYVSGQTLLEVKQIEVFEKRMHT